MTCLVDHMANMAHFTPCHSIAAFVGKLGEMLEYFQIYFFLVDSVQWFVLVYGMSHEWFVLGVASRFIKAASCNLQTTVKPCGTR